jgi:hypothetical protein
MVKYSPELEAALRDAGLMPDPQVVHVHSPSPQVASDATQHSPDETFIEPVWFPRLRHALIVSRTKRGATLFGPRGTGKTSAVKYLCTQENKPLIVVQAAAGATIDDLMGYRDLTDGKTVFTPGPLVEALEKDAVLCIEEANAMHPGVFSKLNTLTDGSGHSLRLPDGRELVPGAGFRVVLCFNEGYAGMKEVNAALRDRLKPIYTTYMTESVEADVLHRRTGADLETCLMLANFATHVRAARVKLGFDLSPRALFDVLECKRDMGATWDEALEWAILDLVGDPMEKRPQRDALKQIADMNSLSGWPEPTWAE